MEEQELLKGRFRDLSRRAAERDYLTHTEFLSDHELSYFYSWMKGEGRTAVRVPFIVYGGRKDADRNMVVFLPSYLTRETFLAGEETDPEVILLLSVRPLNRKFSEELTHRDFLGALMHLGLERGRIGDILVSEEETDIFVDRENAGIIAEELIRVKHTCVRCELMPPSACHIEPQFEEISGSVSSERLDSVLTLAFRLSRTRAQEIIKGENVLVDGRVISESSYILKENQRVSARGLGKFIYAGIENTTKKGRFFISLKKFA